MKIFHTGIFVVVAATAYGQALPRSFDGKPDLSGIWQAFGVALFGETGELRPGQGTKSN